MQLYELLTKITIYSLLFLYKWLCVMHIILYVVCVLHGQTGQSKMSDTFLYASGSQPS